MVIHQGAQRGTRGVEDRCSARDGYSLRYGTEFEPEIDCRVIRDVQLDSRIHHLLESFLIDRDSIRSRRQALDVIETILIALGLIENVGIDVHCMYLCSGHCHAVRITDATIQRRGTFLCDHRKAGSKLDQDNQSENEGSSTKVHQHTSRRTALCNGCPDIPGASINSDCPSIKQMHCIDY